MEILFWIGVFFLLGSLLYLLYHFIGNVKSKDRFLPKGKFFTILIISLLMFVVGGSNSEAFNLTAKKELVEQNATLTKQNDNYKNQMQKLEEENSNLKETLIANEQEIEKLALDLTESEKREKEQKERITAHEEKITNLEKKNIALAKNETTLNNTIKELEEKNRIAATSNTGTSANSSSNTTVNNSSAKPAAAKSAPSAQECNIKGSNSGIYHTPSSSYYNKTKNVARWFCSEQEAINAGYRAPKR